MSSVESPDVLVELSRLGIRASLDGERVVLSANPGVIDAKVQAWLKEFKPAIVDALRAKSRPRRPALTAGRLRRTRASFSQERLWFMSQLDEPSKYNLPVLLRLGGTVSIRDLESALTSVVERHPTLHGAFEEEGGLLYYRVDPVSRIHVEPTPLEGRSAVSGWFDRERTTPFTLTRGPLLRVSLAKSGPEEYWLALVVHHAVADGLSLRILLDEVLATLAGTALKSEEVDALDAVAWEREWLQGDVLEEKLAFWKKYLAGAPPFVDFPTRVVRGVAPSRAASLDLRIAAPARAALGQLAQREGTTLYPVLAALFGAIIGRFSGQHDVVLGTPVANRAEPALQRIVGFFANTMPVRVRFQSNQSFRSFIRDVREGFVQALDRQDVPFDRIVDALGTPRQFSRQAFYEASVTLLPKPKTSFSVGPLQVEFVKADTMAPTCDLELALVDTDSSLEGTLGYDASLFESETVSDLARAFVALVDQASTRPDEALGALLEASCRSSRWIGSVTPSDDVRAAYAAAVGFAPSDEVVLSPALDSETATFFREVGVLRGAPGGEADRPVRTWWHRPVDEAALADGGWHVLVGPPSIEAVRRAFAAGATAVVSVIALNALPVALSVAHEPPPLDRRTLSFTLVDEGLAVRTTDQDGADVPEGTFGALVVAPAGRSPSTIGRAMIRGHRLEIVSDAQPSPGGTPAHDRGLEPTTGLEQAIAEAFSEVLGLTDIRTSDDFFDLGGHSLLAVRVCRALKERHGFDVDLGEFLRAPTVAGVANAIRRPFDVRAGRSLLDPRPGNETSAAATIALVHPFDGNALAFGALVRELDPKMSLLLFQARGLQLEEDPLDDVRALAARYVAELVEARPEGRLVVGGWSFGGLVAFEMARLLVADGRAAAVVLIDTMGPSVPNRITDEEIRFFGNVAGQAGGEAVCRAHARATEDYRFEESKQVDVLLLRAADVSNDDLRARLAAAPHDLGWSKAARSVAVRTIPGDHRSMMRSPGVGALARALEAIALGLPLEGGDYPFAPRAPVGAKE